ncbi:FtsX-like permease family protein [Actinokineospora sp.]|uniref:FtsX-like permease family protein n=1 Tax=Actinokineospora sp. TaxID=1872133 RepID=UPI004037D01D
MRARLNDLAIGIRLAVGGGRTSLARFVLSAVGVGIAVAVLLLASSVGPMMDAREQRGIAQSPNTDAIAGVDPLYYFSSGTEFGATFINVGYLNAGGPAAPTPPGVPKLPTEDEVYLSPGLAELLASPDGELLRPRFPQRVVGVLDRDSVRDPGELFAYTGAGPEIRESSMAVYSFGRAPVDHPLDPGLLLLLLLGTVALLVPVFIFVASSTRIAGAERDRRLSALRLVGSDSGQVRRIAAAEALVSAVAGLVLGAGLFLVGRELAAKVRILDVSVYPSDIVPVWWLAALVALAIPVLAVLTAQFALRRTIIEPLGVVRYSKPIRRRFAWRIGVVALGVALLYWHGGTSANSQFWAYSIAAGATLVLLGVPILLPWVVERTVARLGGGGPSSWQLAIRRLQLDSGTSARVVGGVAVVLAGAIAVQAVLLSQAQVYDVPLTAAADRQQILGIDVDEEFVDAAARAVRGVDGVRAVDKIQNVTVRFDAEGSMSSLPVADCATIERYFAVTGCVDGQLFSVDIGDSYLGGFTPGRSVAVVEFDKTGYRVVATWTVPESRGLSPPVRQIDFMGTVIATPGALPAATKSTSLRVELDQVHSAAAESVRNAVAPLRWRVSMYSSNVYTGLDPNQETYLTIRQGLLIGSVFTLMLAGISLLVLALEHIRERRRPLAILAAGGVPTGALARSLLWQIAVPIGLGVAVAVVTGIALGGLVMRLSVDPLIVDWAGVGVMASAAAVLGVLVSLVTMPFLRSATRLNSLRTE